MLPSTQNGIKQQPKTNPTKHNAFLNIHYYN